MKSIPLFDEHQCYTVRASKIEKEVSGALKALITREIKAGVSHQDLHYVILSTIQTEIIFAHAFNTLGEMKKKKEKK